METAAAQPLAGHPPAPPRQFLARAGLVVFIVYVAMLYVLAFDKLFDWGLFPPKLDRELNAKIAQLGDASLPAAKLQELRDDIVGWNTFSVPLLIKAVSRGDANTRAQATQCLQAISLRFYNEDITVLGSDPDRLNIWWAGMQKKFEEAEKLAEKKAQQP